MTKLTRSLRHRWLVACALAVVPGIPSLAGAEPLTVRVNDAEAVPGGVTAIVLRTYAPRSIGQGQSCVRIVQRAPEQRQPASGPFAKFLYAIVFSKERDAVERVTLRGGGGAQTVELQFASLSGGINGIDGPLAVLYFRVSDTVVPGQSYDVALDLANSYLLDPGGQPIPIDGASGRLRIRAPAQPREAGASAEDTIPGQVAFLGFSTVEPARLSHGRVAITYDPFFATGPPQVFIDPRYGIADLTVDTSVPGRVEATFDSPNGSLNRLPGEIISVRVPTSPDIPHGTQVPIFVDRAFTEIFDRLGNPVPLAFEDDVLVFR